MQMSKLTIPHYKLNRVSYVLLACLEKIIPYMSYSLPASAPCIPFSPDSPGSPGSPFDPLRPCSPSVPTHVQEDIVKSLEFFSRPTTISILYQWANIAGGLTSMIKAKIHCKY